MTLSKRELTVLYLVLSHATEEEYRIRELWQHLYPADYPHPEIPPLVELADKLRKMRNEAT